MDGPGVHARAGGDAFARPSEPERRGEEGADHGAPGDAPALHPGQHRGRPGDEGPDATRDRGGGEPGGGRARARLRTAREHRTDHHRGDGPTVARLLRRVLPETVLRPPERGVGDDRRDPTRRGDPRSAQRVPAGAGSRLLQLAERGARLHRRREPRSYRALRAGARAHARDRRSALRPGPAGRHGRPVRRRGLPGGARRRGGERQPLRDTGAAPFPGGGARLAPRRRFGRRGAAPDHRDPGVSLHRGTAVRRRPGRSGRAGGGRPRSAEVPDHDRADPAPVEVPGGCGRDGGRAGLRTDVRPDVARSRRDDRGRGVAEGAAEPPARGGCGGVGRRRLGRRALSRLERRR